MLFVLSTPSLEHVAAVITVTHLWNGGDIFLRIAQNFNDLPAYQLKVDDLRWHYIEDIVRSKIWALPLPERIKKGLLHFVKPIGMEVIAWCRYHNLGGYLFTFLDTRLPRHRFCLIWTMHGTVDYQKTAAATVKDAAGLSVERRFEMACLNCLEDEARHLFKSIPHHRLQWYIAEEYYDNREFHVILIAYFTCIFSRNGHRLKRLFDRIFDLQGGSIHRFLFDVASSEGSRATCGYFFAKIAPEEKERAFVGSQLREFRQRPMPPTCGLLYYLSKMNEVQQERMFQQYSRDLLTILLRWPMQSLFVEAAERAWRYLEESECIELLDEIAAKILLGYQDYDYINLFCESWRLTSDDCRHQFLMNFPHLKDLFATKQEEMIKFVLNEAPGHKLEKLIENNYDELIRPVLMDEWVISDAALRECKKKAALKSSKDRENIEMEMRSDYVCFLVDLAMENRANFKQRNSWMRNLGS